MDATETEELEKIRKKAMDEVTSALQALENKFPGITEGAAALAGSGVGAAASFGALYTLRRAVFTLAGITVQLRRNTQVGHNEFKKNVMGDGRKAVRSISQTGQDVTIVNG